MSETMVGRVARAIWEADSHPGAGIDGEDAERMARAAIEAMLEPTDEMHDAARDWSHEKYGTPIGLDASKGCWQAMISAALATPTEETL